MAKYFSIYENMDALDFSPLMEAAGNAPETWPKGKKFKVTINGNEMTVTTYFSKAKDKLDEFYFGYDAAAEYKDMKTREEVVEEIRKKDPDGDSDAEYYATPEFRRSSPLLTKEQEQRRREFIAAVATLISNQQTMEAIAMCAPKKKNGTLHKGRVQKIALTGACDGFNTVYAIVGRNKTDTAISITFEEYTAKPGDLDEWNQDFISTYHEDLPITKALEAVFES